MELTSDEVKYVEALPGVKVRYSMPNSMPHGR